MASQATCPPSLSSIRCSVHHFLFLVTSILLCACAWTFPQGDHGLQEIIPTASLDNTFKNDALSDTTHTQIKEVGDTHDLCYPVHFSRNMSFLLTEAFNLLDRVQDTRERNWLKAFIQRLSYLADDIRNHPGVQRPECSQYQGTLTTSAVGSERLFTKQVTSTPGESILLHGISQSAKKSGHEVNSDVPPRTQPSGAHLPTVTERFFPEPTQEFGNPKDDDDLEKQLRSGPPHATTSEPQSANEQPHGMIDVRVWTPTLPSNDNQETMSSKKSITLAPDAAPESNREKLLGEITSQVQKLKQLGGTEMDILSIWKQTDIVVEDKGAFNPSGPRHDNLDFDEEQGAAMGELQADESKLDPTVAPLPIGAQSTTGPLQVPSASELATVESALSSNKGVTGENDEDDLVLQLQSQKFYNLAGESTGSRVRLQGVEGPQRSDVRSGAVMKRLASAK